MQTRQHFPCCHSCQNITGLPVFRSSEASQPGLLPLAVIHPPQWRPRLELSVDGKKADPVPKLVR